MNKLLSIAVLLIVLLISKLSIGQTRFSAEINPFSELAKTNRTTIHTEKWIVNNIHSKSAITIPHLPISIQLNWSDPLPKNEKDKSANEIIHATYKDMALHFMQFGCLSINIHL